MMTRGSPEPARIASHEVHGFVRAGRNLCFDAQSMRLYQLSDTAMTVLRQARAGAIGASRLTDDERQVLAGLEKAGLLGPSRQSRRPEQTGGGLCQLGLVLGHGPGSRWDRARVASAMQLLLSMSELPAACDLILHARRGVPSSEIEHVLETVAAVAQEADRSVQLTVRSADFPASQDLLRALDRHDAALDVVINNPDLVLEGAEPDARAAAALRNAVATIVPNRLTAPVLDLLFEALPTFGFRMIDLDWRCAMCRRDRSEKAHRGDSFRLFDDGQTRAVPGSWLDQLVRETRWVHGRGRVRRGIGLVPVLGAILTGRSVAPGCHAGRSYLVADRSGRLYPCHEVAGDDRFRIGDLGSGIDHEALSLLLGGGDVAAGPCAACWARGLCGGPGPLAVSLPVHRHCEELRQAIETVLLGYPDLGLDRLQVVKSTLGRLRRARPFLHPIPEQPRPLTRPRLLRARGDSMQPLVREGDRLLVRGVRPEQLRFGDIVCFGRPYTCHRLVAVFRHDDEMYGLEQGDAQTEGAAIPLRDVVGRVDTIERGAHRISLRTRARRAQAYLLALRSLVRHLARARRLVTDESSAARRLEAGSSTGARFRAGRLARELAAGNAVTRAGSAVAGDSAS